MLVEWHLEETTALSVGSALRELGKIFLQVQPVGAELMTGRVVILWLITTVDTRRLDTTGAVSSEVGVWEKEMMLS